VDKTIFLKTWLSKDKSGVKHVSTKAIIDNCVTGVTVLASACQANATATPTQQLPTATVHTRVVAGDGFGAGTIAAHAQVAVLFQNSGQVKTVNIKVGGTVKGRASNGLARYDRTWKRQSLRRRPAWTWRKPSLHLPRKRHCLLRFRRLKRPLTSAQAAYALRRPRVLNRAISS